MPDLDPNEEVVTEETTETEETPVSEIPYPEGTAPPVHDPLTANEPQFTLTEAVIQSAGDISEDTIAEMRKGTAKEALEILHSAEYLGLADAIKNGLSAGGGGDGGDTQLPCLYCEVRQSADNVSGLEYVDGSFVDGLIKSVMVVKTVPAGGVIILPTVRGSDRDNNVYVIAGLQNAWIEEEGAQVLISQGLCVKYRWEEHYGPNDEYSTEEIFVGVYSGYFEATLRATSQTTVAAGTQVCYIPVSQSQGAFIVDGDEGTAFGFYVNYDTNSSTWPTNGFVQRYGFVANPNSSVMFNLNVSYMTFNCSDGMSSLSVVCDNENQTIIPYNEVVAYFQPSSFALGVYQPPVEEGGGGVLE